MWKEIMRGKKLPDWIKIKPYKKEKYLQTLEIINHHKLATVCVEANCPNRYECFSSGTATFMILGDTCTRNCRYCNVKKGKPKPVDMDEPARVAQAVKEMQLDYAVITCVTRDDLEDGGAGQFVKTVKEIRKLNPDCKIELLISDLGGNRKALEKIILAKPDVFNHNIEVVKNLFSLLRPEGDYHRSIDLLKKAKEINSKLVLKSGLMVGLGETKEEIIRTFKDLIKAGCQVITVGQYLQPTPNHAPVKKFYRPAEFESLKETALSLGFLKVEAGPLVRSSYRAKENSFVN